MRARALTAITVSSLLGTAPALAVRGGEAIPPDAGRGVYSLSVRSESAGRTRCTGVAIAPDLLLTAGHCAAIAFVGRDALWSVSRGEEGATLAGVTKRILHPEFNQGSLSAGVDLAVLVLDAELEGARPYRSTELPEGVRRLDAFGYGVASSAAPGSVGVLRRAPLDIVSGDGEHVEVSGGARGACRGDSGGPLFHDGVVVAILSEGSAGCRGAARATLLEPHAGFLDAALRDHARAHGRGSLASCSAARRGRAPLPSLAWSLVAMACIRRRRRAEGARAPRRSATTRLARRPLT